MYKHRLLIDFAATASPGATESLFSQFLGRRMLSLQAFFELALLYLNTAKAFIDSPHGMNTYLRKIDSHAQSSIDCSVLTKKVRT